MLAHAFRAAAAHQKMDLNPMSGEELQEVAAKIVEVPSNITAMVKQAMQIKDTKALPKKGK
jgi:hypothetical protein